MFQKGIIMYDGHDILFLVPTGVTFPSGEIQQRLVHSLYEEANIPPEQVEYIEAHGTGTKVSTYNCLVS